MVPLKAPSGGARDAWWAKPIFEFGASGEQLFALKIVDFASSMGSPGHLTMPRSTGAQFCSMEAIKIMHKGAMTISFVQKWFLCRVLRNCEIAGEKVSHHRRG